jgi:predicted Fe-Mo cluster-binding NifX family protein
MNKVALPIENGLLCSVFEHCSEFIIVTFKDGKKTNETIVPVQSCNHGVFPSWLFADGVTDVIVNKIRLENINKFNRLKINVFVGVEVKSPELLVSDFLDGNIEINPELCFG